MLAEAALHRDMFEGMPVRDISRPAMQELDEMK